MVRCSWCSRKVASWLGGTDDSKLCRCSVQLAQRTPQCFIWSVHSLMFHMVSALLNAPYGQPPLDSASIAT
jgi:hypothetical protein